MNKIGICFSKKLQGVTPFSHIVEKLPVYMRLLELIEASGFEPYVLTRRTYKGNDVFEGGWLYQSGKFSLIKENIRIDLVYDRTAGLNFPLEGDSLLVVNNRNFKLLACNKWMTSGVIGEYMPRTLFIKKKEDLLKVLSKIRTELVVLKPLSGLKGFGIFIGSKENAINFKFSNKYGQYIAQEFVDTEIGIPGITPGRHDLRIVVINRKAVWCHVRVPPKGSLLANAAQGGNITEVDYKNIPVSIKKIVNKISNIFYIKYDNPVYSLDFGMDKDGTPYLFEINDTMGLPKWEMKSREVFLKELIANFAEKLPINKTLK